MKNFIQNGDYLEITAPAAISSGEGVLIGDLFGVAVTDIANGAKGILAVKGVYEIAKVTSDGGAAAWAPAYWDATNKKVTGVASGNVQVGLFTEANLTADAKAKVLLDPKTGEKDEMTVSFTKAGAGSLPTGGTQFFIAPVAMRVLGVTASFGTAESTAATLTGDVIKSTDTQAAGTGVSVLAASPLIDLKGTADTAQSPALSATAANLVLAAGNRLSFKASAAGTEIANVLVTVHLARA
jgi:predicted RecA/RadA family phage recombinase